MLKTRIITALLILPVVFAALFLFPNWAWGLFTLGIVLVACWEWSRFCQFPTDRNISKYTYFVLSLGLSAIIFEAYLDRIVFGFEKLSLASFLMATFFWLFISSLWLASTWRPHGEKSYWIAAVAGWIVIFPTWLALLVLHDMSPWLLLTFMSIVWVADIAAYFVGKGIGRHKLAPAISPGKTIEGAAGAILGVAIYFFIWRSLAEQAIERGGDWARELYSHGWLLFGLFILLALMSVLGDLFESWMKRGAGMKDSSNLLPGHGGILDRIDALTSTLPIAGLYVMLMQRL
ncbi:MAG: phosphatidate cytidylyltransferase [Pseudomonadota bacterium]